MIWTKETHESAKFQTFHWLCEISPNLYFDRFFIRAYIKFQLKKRVYVSWDWRVMQNLKKNWLVDLENDIRNLANFYQNT